MIKIQFAALVLAGFSAVAFAQASLGTVSKVQGLVTMTDGRQGGNAVVGSPITDGMTFVTTANGAATLRLDNGCEINLQRGQSVTVRQNMSCTALLASVVTPGGGAVAGGSFGQGLAAVTGLTLVSAVVFKSLSSN